MILITMLACQEETREEVRIGVGGWKTGRALTYGKEQGEGNDIVRLNTHFK